MIVKEFEEALAKLKSEHAGVDEMEIGPVFWGEGGNSIMMTNELTIEKDAGWEGGDAVGIHWSC
jgi:hypothetical protein